MKSPWSRVFEQFVKRWEEPEDPPVPSSEESVNALETAMGAALPKVYRAYLMEVGEFSMEDIFSIDPEEREHLPEMTDLFSTDTVIERSQDWRPAGLPENLIPFASDICGNLLCFEKQAKASEDQPVIHWDHDFNQTREVAPSFLSILEGYAGIARPE